MSGIIGGARSKSGVIDAERNDSQVVFTNVNTYNRDIDVTTANHVNAFYRLVTPRTGVYLFYCVMRLRNMAGEDYQQARISLAKDTAGGTSYTDDTDTNRLLWENWPNGTPAQQGNTGKSVNWIVNCTVAGTAWALFCNSNGSAATTQDFQFLADSAGGAEFGCFRLHAL